MVAMHMARYTNEEKMSNQCYKQQGGSHGTCMTVKKITRLYTKKLQGNTVLSLFFHSL